MKIRLSIAILLCATSCLNAQNWQPIFWGETHHFRTVDSIFPTHTLRIDSTKVEANGDSVFFLNRTVVPQGDFFLVQRGRLLGEWGTRKTDGSWKRIAKYFAIQNQIRSQPIFIWWAKRSISMRSKIIFMKNLSTFFCCLLHRMIRSNTLDNLL